MEKRKRDLLLEDKLRESFKLGDVKIITDEYYVRNLSNIKKLDVHQFYLVKNNVYYIECRSDDTDRRYYLGVSYKGIKDDINKYLRNVKINSILENC